MVDDKTIRIGFAGVGSMGQCAHLRNYPSIVGCEVVAIAEIREKTGRRVAERYGVPNVYTEIGEMLEKEDIDAVVASQPFTRHGIILPELLKAGKPIFIEKPLAGSIETGEKIIESMKGSDSWIMVGYHKRSDPASMYAKAEIQKLKESGELGKMKYVRVIMPPGDWIQGGFNDLIKEDDPAPSLETDPPSSDLAEEDNKRYISFVNYYIHQVNLLRYLLGEPYTMSYADPSGVLFVGHSDSGIPCVIEMAPYSTTIDWQESAMICFEKGYIKLELPAPLASNRPGRLEILKDPGNGIEPTTIVPTLPWVHAMRQQAMNFVAAVKGEMEPMCDAKEALEDLKVAREYIRLMIGK